MNINISVRNILQYYIIDRLIDRLVVYRHPNAEFIRL